MFLGCTSTGRVGLCFLWFYVQELPKAQPAVVLVLKRLRRRGNGLKSHPTDWEKPGIEPATPGLQDIGLSPTPRRLLFMKSLSLLSGLNFFSYSMDWEDIELLLQPKYVFGAIGVVGVFWVFSYVAKAMQIRKKINGRQSECRAALKKLEEYLGENGVGVQGEKSTRPLVIMREI